MKEPSPHHNCGRPSFSPRGTLFSDETVFLEFWPLDPPPFLHFPSFRITPRLSAEFPCMNFAIEALGIELKGVSNGASRGGVSPRI